MKLTKKLDIEIDVNGTKYCGQDCAHLQEPRTGKGAGSCGLFCDVVNSEELVAGIVEYLRHKECIEEFK